MRIITLNVNGIRAAARKGFFEWLPEQNADIVCLQEIKAQLHQLQDAVFYPAGYHCYYRPAEKKGYSGVAVYTRQQPATSDAQLGIDEFDREGRYQAIQVNDLVIASIYLPSGSSSEERQQAKFRFLDFFMPWLQQRSNRPEQYILCGDWNIAHKKIDLKNWRGNQKNSGFLPEERAWMDTLLNQVGYIDAFREVNQEAEQYTWWSNRGQAWANNVGWRIDYQLLSPGLKNRVKAATIYKEQRFSDHAPLIIDYDF